MARARGGGHIRVGSSHFRVAGPSRKNITLLRARNRSGTVIKFKPGRMGAKILKAKSRSVRTPGKFHNQTRRGMRGNI